MAAQPADLLQLLPGLEGRAVASSWLHCPVAIATRLGGGVLSCQPCPAPDLNCLQQPPAGWLAQRLPAHVEISSSQGRTQVRCVPLVQFCR